MALNVEQTFSRFTSVNITNLLIGLVPGLYEGPVSLIFSGSFSHLLLHKTVKLFSKPVWKQPEQQVSNF